jgi:hypothetical protein
MLMPRLINNGILVCIPSAFLWDVAHPRAACPPCRAAPDRYFRMIDRSLRKKRHTPPSPPDLHISDRTPTASSPGHTRQRSASGWRGRDQRRGRARAPVTEARRLALGRAVLGTRGCAPHTQYKNNQRKQSDELVRVPPGTPPPNFPACWVQMDTITGCLLRPTL